MLSTCQDDEMNLPVEGFNLTHAKTPGKERRYILAKIGKLKKFMVEVSLPQSPNYHDLAAQLSSELQAQVDEGKTNFKHLKAWAAQRKAELLAS